CTFKEDCEHLNNSENWLDILSGAKKCPQIHLFRSSKDKTTVTVVGSFSPRHSECVVKNVDTGRMLCKGKSVHNETCTCNIPTRTAYKGMCAPLVFISILSERRRQENLVSPECPGKQVKWQDLNSLTL
ncbi:hypothetical protein K5549_021868, partial [Capra hircus]